MVKKGKIEPNNLIAHMEVPQESGRFGKTNVYILGCFEKRVTLYSQQVRALNLIYSLFDQGLINDQSSIGIIGGGAAGLTAAAGALKLGCQVTILEKNGSLFQIFQNNPVRWLHPHIYDWPEINTGEPDARLPLMNWHAGLVRDVVQQLKLEWSRISQQHTGKLEVVLGANKIDIEMAAQPRVLWHGKNGGSNNKTFQAVIFAVGFGLEEQNPDKPDIPVKSYWYGDSIDNIDDSRERHILISGCGDGGLIELLRVRIREFRHDQMIIDFINDLLSKEIKEKLLAIDEEALRLARDPNWLNDRYNELEIPSEFDRNIKERLRGDTIATLNGLYFSPLTTQSCILNRLLVSRLLRMAGSKTFYLPGRLQNVKPENGGYKVTFEDKTENFDDVIVRLGPTPAINRFTKILRRCDTLRNRNQLDQTRWPIWSDNFFGAVPTTPNGNDGDPGNPQ